MLEQVEWGEFELGILFEKIKVNGLKYKTSSLPSTPNQEYNLPALTAGIQNQGLNNYVPREGATILKNVISISANGANTGATFYQKKEFTVLQDSYAIRWIYDDHALSDNQSLFFVSLISKTIYGKYERTNKAGWERIKKDKIYVPIKDGKIDFDFMDNFIAELEAKHQAELEAYLEKTGLKNYELTSDELTVLKDFKEGNVEWKEFKISALFDKLNLKFKRKNFNKAEDISKIRTDEFNLPLVNAKDGDNGIMYYGRDCDFDNVEMTIDIVNDGAVSTGNVYPQPQKTGVLYNAYLIKPLFPANREVLYFFAATIQKSIKMKYGYEYKASWDRVKEETIYVPIKDNKIDFDCISLIISAVEKMIIKDVVSFADKEMKTIKEVINK